MHILTHSSEMDTREEVVNLRLYPTYHNKKITQFTLGDLHGNAIKLVYVLVRNGICELPIGYQQQLYDELINIYESPCPLSQGLFLRFNQIIDNYLFITNTTVLVRFIGDSFADRGSNDWFTLKIIFKLQSSGVYMRTVLSNHDCRFLCAMGLNGINADLNAIKAKSSDKQNADSFFGLEQIIQAGFIKHDTVLSMIKSAYLPTLVMLDYSLNDQDNLTLFTHAPCDLKSIEALAHQFGVLYKGNSNHHLVEAINAINLELNFCIAHNLLGLVLIKDSPAYDLMWMREKAFKLRRNELETREVNNITFVYGHDKKVASVPSNVIRIDNKLGRSNLDSENETNISYLSNETVSLKPLFKFETRIANKIYASNGSELICFRINEFTSALNKTNSPPLKEKLTLILRNLNQLLDSNNLQEKQRLTPSFLFHLTPYIFWGANVSLCLISYFTVKKAFNISLNFKTLKQTFYGASLVAGFEALSIFSYRAMTNNKEDDDVPFKEPQQTTTHTPLCKPGAIF